LISLQRDVNVHSNLRAALRSTAVMNSCEVDSVEIFSSNRAKSMDCLSLPPQGMFALAAQSREQFRVSEALAPGLGILRVPAGTDPKRSSAFVCVAYTRLIPALYPWRTRQQETRKINGLMNQGNVTKVG
jgi:hypothetical protein